MEKLLEFIGRYKAGSIVYPSVVNRAFPQTALSDIVSVLDSVDRFKKVYVSECPSCKRNSAFYESLEKIPETRICPYCECRYKKNLEEHKKTAKEVYLVR